MIAQLKAKISALAQFAATNADLQKLFNRMGGQSFCVVAFFAATGFVLAKEGKLTDSYAALATSLSAFHIWRAVKQDQK